MNSVVEAKKMIEEFIKTLKRFPSESDFHNQKHDTYNSLFHLFHCHIIEDEQELEKVMVKINNLKYDSSYKEFVDIVYELKELQTILEEFE